MYAGPARAPMIERAPPCGPGSAQPRFPDDEGARASADRLAPRRRHFFALPVVPVAAEGFVSRSASPGTSTSCLPQALKSASKPMATRPFCRSSRPRPSGPAASPAAPTGCARALPPVEALFLVRPARWTVGGRHPFHGDPDRRRGGRRLCSGRSLSTRRMTGKGFGKALVEEGLARARAEGFSPRAARRRHALLRPVRLQSGSAGADHLAGTRRSRAAACS